MKQFLSQKEWLALPKDVRATLVYAFAINKSEGTRVMAGEIVSDGCSSQDLINGLTIGKMIEYLGNDWNKVENDALFEHLLSKVINKIQGNGVKESDVKNESKEQVNSTAEKGSVGDEVKAGEGSGGKKGKGKTPKNQG